MKQAGTGAKSSQRESLPKPGGQATHRGKLGSMVLTVWKIYRCTRTGTLQEQLANRMWMNSA